jgi:transcriptional regulator with XRE-family HTH domain
MKQHLSSVVKARRRMLEMSQQALAERAGLRREKINRFESKGEDISFNDLCKVLDALGYEIIAAPKHGKKESADDGKWRSSYIPPAEQNLAPRSFKEAGLIDGSKARVINWGKVPR